MSAEQAGGCEISTHHYRWNQIDLAADEWIDLSKDENFLWELVALCPDTLAKITLIIGGWTKRNVLETFNHLKWICLKTNRNYKLYYFYIQRRVRHV